MLESMTRSNVLDLPKAEASEPLARLRSHRLLHCSVIFVVAAGILFLYYGYTVGRFYHSWPYLDWFWTWFSLELRMLFPGLLMLFPILYAVLTLRWKHSLIAVALLLVAIGPYVAYYSWEVSRALANFSILAIPPILIISFEIKRTSDAKERLAKEQRNKQEAEVMRQLFLAQEDERTRIARELHDSVGQNLLYTATLGSSVLESVSLGDGRTREKIERLVANCMSMVAETRCICQDLWPNTLSLGLIPALRSLCDEFQQETGIETQLNLAEPVRKLTRPETLALFRVVQAALSNVVKHAEASRVRVEVAQVDGHTVVEVEDNGRGFAVSGGGHVFAVHGKLGILTMEQRAESIGGTLEIKSVRSLGTLVRISVDAEQTQEADTGVNQRGRETDHSLARNIRAVRSGSQSGHTRSSRRGLLRSR